VLILVATDVLFAYTPTVPVRASCVPLTGQAACTAAFGSCVLGGGALGGVTPSCDVRTVDVAWGLGRGASMVTCGNGVLFGCCCTAVAGGAGEAPGCMAGACCAGVAGGVGGASGCVAGACCAGVPDGDGDPSEGAACCAGGDSSARRSFALTGANAR
jgi:hypothetical protein